MQVTHNYFLFSLSILLVIQQQQQNYIYYLSRVKYIITGSLVVYIVALNKTKRKNPTDPTKNPTDTLMINFCLVVTKCSTPNICCTQPTLH